MSDQNRVDIEVQSALSDIDVLLDYLGKQPHTKLQDCFQGARKPPESPPVVTASPGTITSPGGIMPPANTYFDFLNRISMIQSMFASTGHIHDGENKNQNELTNLAFVLWTRDFLSALAAPATAGSIRITNAYMEQRFVKSKNGFDQYRLCAKKTISTVKWMQNMGIGAILFSVIISIYALAGHQILAAKLSALSTLKQINEKIELAQRQDTSQPIVNPALLNYLKNAALSRNEDSFNKIGASDDKDSGRLNGKFFFCDNIDVTNFSPPIKDGSTLNQSAERVVDIGMPSNGPSPSGRYYYYGSLDEITLCNERKTALRQLLAISDELISWQRTVTNPLPVRASLLSSEDLPKAIPDQRGSLTQIASTNADRDLMRNTADYILSMPGLLFGHFFGGVLGKSSEVSSELATREMCVSFFGTETKCAGKLGEYVEYYGTIPDSILSSINLYILPCLFAFIGSVTAGVKYVRTQIDSYSLNFTDRGRLIQNEILGLMAGSVIGLFATYLLHSEQGLETLSVSAMAFLAGYNIPALFNLFDNLSLRLLQGNQVVAK